MGASVESACGDCSGYSFGEGIVPAAVMQNSYDLHKPFFLEEAVPAERRLDFVEATFRLVRSALIVVRLNIGEVTLGVGEDSDRVAHAIQRARRRVFRSSSVM